MERIIKWKKNWRGPEFTRVWVDVQKLDAMLSGPFGPFDHVLYAGKNGILGKYAGVDEFVASGKDALDMPEVGICSAHNGHVDHKIAYFRDGRHRFAWMRDHGALALPVAVRIDEARKVAELVGTNARVCRVTMSYIPAWNPLSAGAN